MRILLITGSFPPMKCGVGDYSYNLAKGLIANHRVKVAVLTSELCLINNKIDGIELFPVIKRWRFQEIIKVIKIIQYWSPDIIHIQYPTQGYSNGFLPWLLPIISFFMRKKVVQTWHEPYGRRNIIGRRNTIKLSLKLIVPFKLIVVHSDYKIKNIPNIVRWMLLQKKPIFISNASAIPKSEHNSQTKNMIKEKYLGSQKRLIVFFGFIYSHKGVELLFDIADPTIDQIVIAGEIDKNGKDYQDILKLASTDLWLGKVNITGYLSTNDVAILLAVADAVILPFRLGGGEWSTSIHAAVLSGAFTISTSTTQNGYDRRRNLYFSKIDNIEEVNYYRIMERIVEIESND